MYDKVLTFHSNYFNLYLHHNYVLEEMMRENVRKRHMLPVVSVFMIQGNRYWQCERFLQHPWYNLTFPADLVEILRQLQLCEYAQLSCATQWCVPCFDVHAGDGGISIVIDGPGVRWHGSASTDFVETKNTPNHVHRPHMQKLSTEVDVIEGTQTSVLKIRL